MPTEYHFCRPEDLQYEIFIIGSFNFTCSVGSRLTRLMLVPETVAQNAGTLKCMKALHFACYHITTPSHLLSRNFGPEGQQGCSTNRLTFLTRTKGNKV